MSSGDTGEAIVDKASLTFTPANWNVAQRVTVTGVDDPTVDGEQMTDITVSVDDLNSDDAFDAVADQTVNAITEDNDIAALTVSIVAASISENGGSTTATVSRNTDTSADLIVTLASSDSGEATVPVSITIPAGQTTSAPFTIDGVDDLIVDGTQTVTVTASAAGHADGGDSVDVLDDEVSTLFEMQFDFGKKNSPVEPGYTQVTGSTTYSSSLEYGWLTAVKDLSRGPGTDLTGDFNYQRAGTFVIDVPNGTYQVTLMAGDAFQHDQQVFLEGVSADTFTTPANDVAIRTYTVMVSDGQLTLMLDGRGGIDPNMVINALRLTSGPALNVAIADGAISENGGTTTGTVTRSGSTASELIVTLSSNDTSEATVPQTVTILAGQSSATFDIAAVDDAIVDGTQLVTITASAAGHADGGDTVDVSDDELASNFERQFDFGKKNSPVEPGYTQVTGMTTYSNSVGHGWLERVKDLSRGPGTDLTGDFNYERVGTFVIDVPNGTYQLTLTAGEAFQHDQQVFLEGLLVDTFTTPANDVVIRTYTVTVGDGQLTLLLDGRGGIDPNMVINALQLNPVPAAPLAAFSAGAGTTSSRLFLEAAVHDDLWIGQTTDDQTNDESLKAVLEEWESGFDGSDGSDLEGIKLTTPTIHGEGERDTMDSEQGQDWFFAELAADANRESDEMS